MPGLRSSGEALDGGVRASMERALGFDFSRVRIHRGAEAVASARALGARAYTVGHDIVVGDRAVDPATPSARRLLAHELVHVVQQTAGTAAPPAVRPSAVASRGDESLAAGQLQTRVEVRQRTSATTLQGDFALEPPHPEEEGRTLSEAEMNEALDFDRRVLDPYGADLIRELRDVFGVSQEPAVIDEDLVNAIVRWQAVQGLPQDGKIGPRSARPLFREIGAEGAGRCEVKSGPTYVPSGVAPVVTDGAGNERATFRLRAEFENDPANGVFPSCCEIRQLISWNAAAVASFAPDTVPHGGFAAGTAAGSWVEDRDAANNRYGHRSGPFSDPQSFDQYLDATGRRNQAFGHLYRGSDTPGGTPLAGTWRFALRVVDVCNGEARVGTQTFVRVDW